MIGLVKYECGCIGFRPVGTNVVLVKTCDGDMHDDTMQMSLASGPRGESLAMKQFVPLSDDDQEAMVTEIGQLIYEGYKFRSIKSLLR